MSDYQDACSHVKDPAISERQRRTNWFLIQGLVLGLMLGIVLRVAWDYGIISFFVQTLRDVSVALWTMTQDSAAAWGDFFRFVMHSMNK